MDLGQAVVIGLVQGLTEFLPISSTAHVRIIPSLFHWHDPGAAVTAVTQLGTLAAVLLFFRRELSRLLRAGLISVFRYPHRRQWNDALRAEVRLSWSIVLGTVPIAVFGLLFKQAIENDLRSLTVIGTSLIVLAVLLAIAELAARHQRPLERIGFFDTQAIGLAQAMALIPGVSRSGVTITAGLFMGLTREGAARFSFLLSVPAVLASGVFELIDLIERGLAGEGLVHLILATLVAAVTGYASIAFLLRWLQTRSTFIFIVYRIALGSLILGLSAQGLIR